MELNYNWFEKTYATKAEVKAVIKKHGMRGAWKIIKTPTGFMAIPTEQEEVK